MASEFVYLSFAEEDREVALNVRLRALNPHSSDYDFVAKLPFIQAATDTDKFREHIEKLMKVTARAIVLIGDEAYKSTWIPHEVDIALQQNKPVYAIKLTDKVKYIPTCLEENNIEIHSWGEETLNELANI